MIGAGGGFVAGAIISKLILDTTKWDSATKGVVSKTGRLGNQLGQFGSALSTKVTAPLALAGAAAVKCAADFEQSLVNAFSVTGESSLEVRQQMEDLAREMGTTSVFSAKEAADAMYYMASAGWKANDMLNAVQPTLDLAAATQTDLANATEVVISTLNQFQLGSAGAGRVTNVFASAISNSQATMDRLQVSMRYVGPIFNSLGKSVEETTSVLMSLYNAGIDASMAGTSLRMGMVKLMTPTKRTSEALGRLGLTFDDVNPKTHAIADIIDELGKRGAETRDIMEIFGARAGPAFAALIAQGGDALRDFESKITGTKRASEMAEMQIDTLKGSMKLMKNAVQEAGISFGQMLAPVVRNVAEGIRSLALKFAELGPETKKFIMTVAGIAAALGPLALIMGKVLLLVDKIKMALIASKAAFITSAAGVGILLAALGALVVGYMKVAKARDEANAAAQRAANTEDDLWAKLKKAADAAGMSNREFAELTNKYKLNAAAAAMAIRKGKEGADIQRELAKVSAEHKEEIDKQKGAIDASIPSIGEITAEFEKLAGKEDDAKKKAEEFADFLKDLGIKTIEQKSDRIKTLSEYLETLNQLYRDGKIDLKEYTKAANSVKEEIKALSTTIQTVAIPAARFSSNEIAAIYAGATGEMQQHTQDFTEHLKTKTVEVIDIGAEMSSTFAGSFNESIVGMLEGTMSWKDGILNIFGDLKSKAIQIFADMATGYIMNFAQKLITGTLESTTSVASQLQSTATNLINQVGSWSPGGIVGSAISGAISGLFSGIFGGGGMSSATAQHIHEIVDNTKRIWDVLFIDFKEEVHTSQNLLRDIISRMDFVKNKTDVISRLISKENDFLKIIAEKLGKLTSAQGGAVFTGTQLAVMHGTPSNPEIAAPAPMLERFIPVSGGQKQITLTSYVDVNIEVKDQLDPHTAQRIARDQLTPEFLRALEVNDKQFRTKLEEILKLRV